MNQQYCKSWSVSSSQGILFTNLADKKWFLPQTKCCIYLRPQKLKCQYTVDAVFQDRDHAYLISRRPLKVQSHSMPFKTNKREKKKKAQDHFFLPKHTLYFNHLLNMTDGVSLLHLKSFLKICMLEKTMLTMLTQVYTSIKQGQIIRTGFCSPRIYHTQFRIKSQTEEPRWNSAFLFVCLFCFFCLFVFVFRDRVFLYSPG